VRAANVDLESLLAMASPEPMSGCWLWTGSSDSNGYPRIGRRSLKVTRLVLEQSTGIRLGDRLACHRCDNPSCINPAHLFSGSPHENMQDKIRKGRMRGQFQSGPDSRRSRQQPSLVCSRGHQRSFDRHGKGYCAKCNWLKFKARRA
jgi:hypothetical protein